MLCTFIRPPSAIRRTSSPPGGHFNPTSKQHGFDNPQGHHAGDMMNFTVKENGTAKATVKDDEVVLGTGSEANSLLANGGTAIMVHAKADDYKTDPLATPATASPAERSRRKRSLIQTWSGGSRAHNTR